MTGIDGLSLKYIKDSLPILNQFITCIINTSIVTGIFPNQWKHATVIPIYKKGDKLNPANYRPISLLPILSKVLEKTVAAQLLIHLHEFNLLSNYQFGFRPNLSTENALTMVTDTLYQTMEDGNITLLTLLDLSKAFDSVNHTLLLSKLKKVNCDTFWFSDYLTNRKQSVKINKITSMQNEIKFGVPQGSILGPLLFIIFINDLFETFNDVQLVGYVDDLQVLLTDKPENHLAIKNRAETSLNRLMSWYRKNGLKLNPDKTECIMFGSKNLLKKIPSNFSIQFANTTIHPSKNVRNLGVHFDESLSFESHINKACAKANQALVRINRVKHLLDQQTRIIAVNSLALSHLNYCSTIWGTCSKKVSQIAQRSQNFAVKVMANGNYNKRDHVTPLIKNLEILNMENKYKYNLCSLMYKILNSILPNWLTSFHENENHSDRNTRQSENLFIPYRRTTAGKQTLNIRGGALWNTLPSALKRSRTLPTFKSNLHKYLLAIQNANE